MKNFGVQIESDRCIYTCNNEMLICYNFPKEDYRPFWHPLCLPGSPPLTMNQPSDHVHHQGLWMAWKKVNGVNFWEQSGSSVNSIREGFGRIVHREFSEDQISDDSLKFVSHNSWIDWRGISHLEESRSTTIHKCENDHLVIEINFELNAINHDVTLDLMRGEPQKGGLFYSGLAIRFDNRLTPGDLLTDDGRSDVNEIFGSRSRWCSFTGTHSDDNEKYTIAIIDQPSNPRHPTIWWVRNGKNYGLIHPSPTYAEPLKIPHGDQIRFEYRIVIHRGSANAELIDKF